jgi:hypothetical protein
MAFHLAQINIGRLVAPSGDARLADFVAQLDPLNKLADATPGFVWRLQSSSGNAIDVVYSDDPLVIVNMSVWESLAALRDYTYASRHMQVFRDRAKWFEKMDKPHYCLWWCVRGTSPQSPKGNNGWSTIRPTEPRSSPSGLGKASPHPWTRKRTPDFAEEDLPS